MAEMRLLYLSSKPHATRRVLHLRSVEVTMEEPARKYICWIPYDTTQDATIVPHIPGVRELAFPISPLPCPVRL